MITLISGMMRSGSTWSYNVARICTGIMSDLIGTPYAVGYGDGDLLDKMVEDALSKNILAVFKCHFPGEGTIKNLNKGKIANILTIRDPRDCVASRRQFQSNEPFLDSVSKVKRCCAIVPKMRANTLIIRYEDMMKDTILHVKKIMGFYGMPTDEEDIVDMIHLTTSIEKAKEIAEEVPNRNFALDPLGHRIDGETFLHENHIQGGATGKWEEELTVTEKMIVKENLHEEIKYLGYSIS